MECIAGHPMQPGQRYCPTCGLATTATPEVTAPPSEPPRPDPFAPPPTSEPVRLLSDRAKAPGGGALALSILGIFSCGVTSIIGLILGVLARRKAKATNQATAKATSAIVVGAVVLSFIAVAIVGGLIGQSQLENADQVAGGSGSSSTGAATQDDASAGPSSPSPENASQAFESLLVNGLIGTSTCKTFEGQLKDYEELLEKRGPRLEAVGTDPFDAAKFVDGNGWILEDLEIDFRDTWNQIAKTEFDAQSGGKANQIDSLDGYLNASLKECGLLGEYEQQATDVGKVNRQQAMIARVAENVPWYPKGFRIYEPGLAIKWTDESCDISSGYCWTLRVISQDGCPGGLYAEINILQNDVVTGYSNDLLGSLPAEKVAVLEFQDFGGSGQKAAQITQISCYA